MTNLPPVNAGLLSPAQLFAPPSGTPPVTQGVPPEIGAQSILDFLPQQSPLQTPQVQQGQAHESIAFVQSETVHDVPQLHLPPRPAGAPTGSQFWNEVQQMPPAQREQAIARQIISGNVPPHLRSLEPVTLQAQTPQGETLQAIAHVTPDYLAIGSQEDHVLVPMSPITAQAIADATGTTLPTRKLVDHIYAQAEIQLSPSPMQPGSQMTSVAYFSRHDETIQSQRRNAGAAPGDLMAGHKKDVVITNRLDRKPNSVAIYGWHQSESNSIQPLSTLHENTYADYSHGIRLVGPTVKINGTDYATSDILKHPQWSVLLSDEGAISNPRAVRP